VQCRQQPGLQERRADTGRFSQRVHVANKCLPPLGMRKNRYGVAMMMPEAIEATQQNSGAHRYRARRRAIEAAHTETSPMP